MHKQTYIRVILDFQKSTFCISKSIACFFYSPLFKNDPVVHKITTALALIPALFDMINALPDALRSTSIIQTILSYAERYLPMFNLGFSWLTFSLAGLIIGLTIHFARGTSYATIED